MPGGLERQNAFSEYYGSKTFVELQCHICKEYEFDGDYWIKIKCKCNNSSAECVYTHRHCLKMSGKCKQCGQAFIQQDTAIPAAAVEPTTKVPHYSYILLGFMRTYRAQLAVSICCIIGLSIFYDALDCITVDLLAGEELQGLTDAEYLYLPRFHRKCFQSKSLSIRIKFFICCTLIIYLFLDRSSLGGGSSRSSRGSSRRNRLLLVG
ncbi:hypothetical protein PS15m_000665 [Mucor circinelloides]